MSLTRCSRYNVQALEIVEKHGEENTNEFGIHDLTGEVVPVELELIGKSLDGWWLGEESI